MSNENHNLDGIAAPQLEETSYDASKTVRNSLSDIAAPQLEDTYYDASQSRKNSLDDIAAPQLDDNTYVNTSSRTDALQQQVAAAQLDDEPAPAPPPVRSYIDPDLERAKEEGKRLAAEQGAPEQELTDEQKAARREMNRQLMIAQNAAMAEKGKKLVIICMILGIVSSVCLSVFMKLDFQEGVKETFLKLSDATFYYAFALIVSSVIAIFKVPVMKKISSFIFGLNTLLMLFPISTMIPSKVDTTQSIIFYAIALICSGYICFTLSSNDNVAKYYKRTEEYYY